MERESLRQLENKDPARQPFFESVDLAYTIIFAIGAAPSLSFDRHNLRIIPYYFSSMHFVFDSFRGVSLLGALLGVCFGFRLF